MKRSSALAFIGSVTIWACVSAAPAAAASWRVQAAASPTGATSTTLAGVDCNTRRDCTAVGSYQTSSGQTYTLAEGWNGVRWTIEPTSNSGTSSSLDSVSCLSPWSCIAVGRSGGSTLAERFNGFGWRIIPTPAAANSELAGVSCTSPRACTAVGSTDTQSLAERFNGTTWTIQPTSTVAPGGFRVLLGVSCASRNSCSAVGQTVSAGGSSVLAEHWDGITWTIQNAVHFFDDFLRSVSCTAPDRCIAVGSQFQLGPTSVIEKFQGGTWTAETPTDTAPGFNGVSCVRRFRCTAVGQVNQTAAEQRRFGDWTLQATPNPAGAATSEFWSVSCTGGRACTAVGDSNATVDGPTVPLIERYSS